jgi:hypothetical protein
LRINGVRLDPLAPDQLHERVSSFVGCGLSHVVHFLPAHPTVIARKDLAYRDVLNRGDLNLVDGASVALAAKLFGHQAPRTTGSDALSMLPAIHPTPPPRGGNWALASLLRADPARKENPAPATLANATCGDRAKSGQEYGQQAVDTGR